MFDPYHKWLAIPPEEQPPHHYRLLAVRLFETDADVIEAAAEQRMAHVRIQQNGQHAAESQKILNELSAAKLCLLMPERRQIYDQALRIKLASSRPTAMPMQPPPLPQRAPVAIAVSAPDPDQAPVPLDFVAGNEAQQTFFRKRHGAERSPVSTLVGVSAISLAVVAVAFFVQAARTRQHVITEEAISEAPVESASPTIDADKKAELPAFPEITPHAVTLPDPQMDARPGLRELWKQAEAFRKRPPQPMTVEPVKPVVPTPPPLRPTKPDSQSDPLPASEVEAAPARDPNQPLANWVAQSLKDRTLERTISGGGGSGGSLFAEVPTVGALLSGFNLTVADGGTITSVQPVFTGVRGSAGGPATCFGTERGNPVSLIARRGFAVGAIKVQGSNSVEGLEVVFVRVTRTGLAPEDNYTSPWVGRRSSEPSLTLGGDGLPVVGIHGRAGAALFSLGLVQLPEK